MMITETFILVFDLIIFLGVAQGIFISWFFIRSGRRDVKPNLYQGLLLLFLSLSMFEELLNNTGYIVRVLAISSFGITCVIYWFLVLPFNITRVIFGMKTVARKKKPVIIENSQELDLHWARVKKYHFRQI